MSENAKLHCAYSGCTAKVTEVDNFCYGCEKYICDKHDPNEPVGHGHSVEKHWETL